MSENRSPPPYLKRGGRATGICWHVDLSALAAVNPWTILVAGLLIHLVIVSRNPSPRRGVNWGLLLVPILLAAFIFGITFVAGRDPSGLHVRNADYWRSPEHYPQALAHLYTAQAWLASLLGVFTDYATIVGTRLKQGASRNGGLASLGLVVFFVAAMALWAGILGSGWDVPAR